MAYKIFRSRYYMAYRKTSFCLWHIGLFYFLLMTYQVGAHKGTCSLVPTVKSHFIREFRTSPIVRPSHVRL